MHKLLFSYAKYVIGVLEMGAYMHITIIMLYTLQNDSNIHAPILTITFCYMY